MHTINLFLSNIAQFYANGDPDLYSLIEKKEKFLNKRVMEKEGKGKKRKEGETVEGNSVLCCLKRGHYHT